MNKETLPINSEQVYFQSSLSRLISGLREDADDTTMFEFMKQTLEESPDFMINLINDTIDEAGMVIGQNRRGGSSATIFYPIEAAVKYVAAKINNTNDVLFASSGWSYETFITFLITNRNEIIATAGSKTTAKNLPQRAMQALWLIDNTSLVSDDPNVAFIELGASVGLLLDAVRSPKQFNTWFKAQASYSESQRVIFGEKLRKTRYPAIGVDLTQPDILWNFANILDPTLKDETQNFLREFPNRTEVVVADATVFSTIPEIQQFTQDTSDSQPIVITCFMMYQLTPEMKSILESTVRAYIAPRNGVWIKTDIAKYMGVPSKAGGAVSWIEDGLGNICSPKILLTGKTISQWEILKEDI